MPGEVFDVHVVVGTVGNNCASTAPQIEIALPPGVQPAISQANPIRCYFSPDFTNWSQVTQAQGCPSTAGPGVTSHPSISTWYELNPEPPYPQPLWLLAQGTAIEIQVPVVANRQMNGIADPSGCVCVVASVTTTNGQSRPDNLFTWSSSFPSTGAYQHLFVFPAKDTPGPGKLEVNLRVPKQSLRQISRRGQISASCTTNRTGTCRTSATVSRSDALRLGLKLPRRPGRVTIATGARRNTVAGKAQSVPARLTGKAKAALKRSKRPVKIRVTAIATSTGAKDASAQAVLTARR